MHIRLSLREIAQIVEGEFDGDPEFQINRLWPIFSAGPQDLSLLSHPNYKRFLSTTQAGILLVDRKTQIKFKKTLRVSNTSQALNKLIHFCLDQNPTWPVQIEPSAQIDPGVHIYPNVSIGKNVKIQSGAVIGSPGFGFKRFENAWTRLPHIGSVVIEDDVEIGANTCIAQAKFGETRIGRGSKIDNLVQIGHGVQIGEDCLICGCVGIAGSAHIGSRCVIAGNCGVADHLWIAPDVTLGAQSGVMQNIEKAGLYWGTGPQTYREELKCLAWYQRLPKLMSRKSPLREVFSPKESASTAVI